MAVERAERKWRPGPGDEQKNSAMIKYPQSVSEWGRRPEMIKHGNEIERQHGDGEYDRAGKESGPAGMPRGA